MGKRYEEVRPQPNSKRGRVVSRPDGAKITRDLANKRAGWIVCPDCGEERYATIPPEGSQKFRDSTWRCAACAGKRRRQRTLERRGQFVSLPDGTQARRDSEDPDLVWIVCPDCEEERSRGLPSYGSEAFQKITSRCMKCSSKLRRTLKGEFPHKSGAVFYLDPTDRDPARPNGKTRFRCANAGRDLPDCLEDTGYTWLYNKNRPSWNGLCENCLSKVNHRWRLKTADVIVYDRSGEGEQKGPAISEILYSKSKDATGDVEVTYLNAACRHSELWSRSSIATRFSSHMSSNKRLRRERWPRFCRDCRLHPEKMLQAVTSNGDRQSDKKLARRAKKLLDVINAIIAVRHDVQNPKLTRDEQMDLVKQWRVAGKLGIGDVSDTIAAANQVGERLRRLEVRNMLPGTSEPYRSLVKTVFDKTDLGMSPNDIASEMLQCLSMRSVA